MAEDIEDLKRRIKQRLTEEERMFKNKRAEVEVSRSRVVAIKKSLDAEEASLKESEKDVGVLESKKLRTADELEEMGKLVRTEKVDRK